jgi:hypothetical protein
MAPFIEAHRADLEDFAALSQTPVTAYGRLVNVSAEGLVEARASMRAKVGNKKNILGPAACKTLVAAALAENRHEDADLQWRHRWADEESQTLAQAVDAWGKAAEMLGIPPEVLWDRIPGVDLPTAEMWRRHAEDHPAPAARAALAEAQAAQLAAQAVSRSMAEDTGGAG